MSWGHANTCEHIDLAIWLWNMLWYHTFANSIIHFYPFLLSPIVFQLFCYAVSVEVSQKDLSLFILTELPYVTANPCSYSSWFDRMVDRAKMAGCKTGATRILRTRTRKRVQAVLKKDRCFRDNISVYPRARVIDVHKILDDTADVFSLMAGKRGTMTWKTTCV